MTIKRVFHNNFRPDKRRKLVGLKKKNPKQIEEGTADFPSQRGGIPFLPTVSKFIGT